MKRETNHAKPHIVLCAPRQTGKTTLIERIIREALESSAGSPIPIYGFQTKKLAGSDGTSRIYMFPAGGDLTGNIPTEARYIGSTCGRVKDVCPETFDTYGAPPAGQPAKAGDQTIPVDYLERIRRHPRVHLYMLTGDNRDAVYDEVRDILFAGRKEAKDHEPL